LEVIGQPGTLITAELISPGSINLAEAKQYLREFVRLVDVPIFVNEELVSQVPLEQAVPAIPTNYHERLKAVRIGPNLQATGDIAISGNAIMRLVLTDLIWNEQTAEGAFGTAQQRRGYPNSPERFWSSDGSDKLDLRVRRRDRHASLAAYRGSRGTHVGRCTIAPIDDDGN
ncbi:hypothetical protein, partial [Rhizobium sp. AN6A]|uniref:hypothetical protein n=1 Tax=Rhizobium sp. AN6A TaxID=1841611 RepID=UPI000BD6DD82